MHENIQHRITELKEIALQIMNLIGQKNYGAFPYAYTYLEAMTNGKIEDYAKGMVLSIAYAYESQLLYALSNLQQWRGNDARQYKLLLNEYLRYFQGKTNTGKLSENVNPMWQAIRGIGD